MPSELQEADLGQRGTHVEFELLTLCSRTDVAGGELERIRSLLENGGFEWGELVRMGGYHGVQPLLYHTLRLFDPALLSGEHMGWLQARVGARAAHSLILVQLLGQLADVFERERMRVLPIKGAPLAFAVYGGVALRPFVDVDLVVRPGDFGRMEEVLHGMGFGSRSMNKLQKASYLFIHRQSTFWGRMKNIGLAAVHVDVHTAMMPPGYSYSERFDALWERARPLEIAGHEVKTLEPGDLLLVLCYHGFKNRWDRLKYICDVAELVRRQDDMAWDTVLQRAGAMRSRRVLGLGLYLASKVLDAPLPSGPIMQLTEEQWVQHLGAAIVERLPRQAHMRAEPYLDRVQLNVFGQDSLLGGVRYGAYTLARRASELLLPEEG